MSNRLEPHMNRTLLLIALAAAVPARAADEFKPIKASESVTYPLPPIPLPAAPPADGKWAETEDSPALRVSRAWVKLGQEAGGGLAREAEEQIRSADRDERLTNSACYLSPETCQQGDPADKALQDEISALVKGTLEAGGPDGGLSVYSLRRKAGLLALRARVMAAVTQRAAARLATEVATQQDGQGSPRSLPSPVAPVGPVARRRV